MTPVFDSHPVVLRPFFLALLPRIIPGGAWQTKWGARNQNLVWLHTRQVLCLLYYLSCSCVFILSRTFFYFPKLKLWYLLNSHCFQFLETTSLLPLDCRLYIWWLQKLQMASVNGAIYSVYPLWLIFLSLISSLFMHVKTQGKNVFLSKAEQYSIVCILRFVYLWFLSGNRLFTFQLL